MLISIFSGLLFANMYFGRLCLKKRWWSASEVSDFLTPVFLFLVVFYFSKATLSV
jgi:hypothetical protein